MFEDLMRRSHSVVKKVNSSTKATEKLVNLSRNKLVKDCPTRWSSMLNYLLEVKDQLKVVLDKQGWDNFAASEWS